MKAALRQALADVTNPAWIFWTFFLDSILCLIVPHWDTIPQLLALFGMTLAFRFVLSLTRSAHNALKR